MGGMQWGGRGGKKGREMKRGGEGGCLREGGGSCVFIWGCWGLRGVVFLVMKCDEKKKQLKKTP